MCGLFARMTQTKEGWKYGRKHEHPYLPYKLKVCTISRKIKVESLFTNYRIQSMADSHITMELSTDALLGALRSAASSASSSGGSSRVNSDSTTTDQVIIKLAKKNNQAVLAVEIHGTTRVGKPMLVAHDVKIELMSPYDAARLNEPLCPDPNVCIRPFINPPTLTPHPSRSIYSSHLSLKYELS